MFYYLNQLLFAQLLNMFILGLGTFFCQEIHETCACSRAMRVPPGFHIWSPAFKINPATLCTIFANMYEYTLYKPKIFISKQNINVSTGNLQMCKHTHTFSYHLFCLFSTTHVVATHGSTYTWTKTFHCNMDIQSFNLARVIQNKSVNIPV